MSICQNCGKKTDLPYKCKFCGGYFCDDCRLPPKHNCTGISSWKERQTPSRYSVRKSKKRTRRFIPTPTISQRKRKSSSLLEKSLILLLVGIIGFVAYMDYSEEVNSFFQGVKDESGEKMVSLKKSFTSVNTSVNESKEAIEYVNEIRRNHGKGKIEFDKRVYKLAMARVKDMDKYDYMDHTNPETGSCPYNMKDKFGLSPGEDVAENAYMDTSDYHSGMEEDAIDSWMDSRGHRYNLLYSNHVAGAVACYKEYCVFLGLNYDGFGRGCYTAEEGVEYWRTH